MATSLSQETELFIFRFYKNTCQGCRRVLPTKYDIENPKLGGDVDFLVIDHINGRTNNLSNLQALCWRCNSMKAGKTQNNFKLSVALKRLGHPVVYYPSLAKILGLKESIFLCQLIYWTPKGRHEKGDGWIYKSVEEMDEETGLSYKEQLRIRQSLVEKGLIEESYDRENHRLYFKVNVEELDKQGEHITNGHMPIWNIPPAQPECGTLPLVSSYNEAKTTTKTTTKTTKDIFISDFEKVYQQYPRHVGKRAAELAFYKAIDRVKIEKQISTKDVIDFLYQRIMNYSAACIHKDKQFIPHMATWLNQDRFVDDPIEWAVETNGQTTKAERRNADISKTIRRVFDPARHIPGYTPKGLPDKTPGRGT